MEFDFIRDLEPALDAENGSKAAAARTTVKEKWEGAVTDGSGFVAVPVSLLRLQTDLRLSATDMLVLINLLVHWWEPNTAVFPRSTTIANRMGVTKRTVQRSVHKMLRAGLISRNFDSQGRRVFEFTRLVRRLAHSLGTSLARKEGLGA